MGSLALLWRSDCPGEAVVKIQGNCAGTKLWLLCGVVPWLLSQWLSSALVGPCLFLSSVSCTGRQILATLLIMNYLKYKEKSKDDTPF